MKLKNSQIFEMANNLVTAFQNETRYLPAKLNFYIQKNRNILVQLAGEIDSGRMTIIQHYGIVDNQTGGYIIPDDKKETVNKELNDLAQLIQEVKLEFIPLSYLEGLEFTTKQMQALMFMIKDEVEE